MTEMTIDMQGASAQASAHWKVSGAEPLMLTSLRVWVSHSSQAILPYAINAKWMLTDGAWELINVSVVGDVLKSDGTPGKNNAKRDAFERPVWRSEPGDGSWADDAPQWLRDLVASHDPQTGSQRAATL